MQKGNNALAMVCFMHLGLNSDLSWSKPYKGLLVYSHRDQGKPTTSTGSFYKKKAYKKMRLKCSLI